MPDHWGEWDEEPVGFNPNRGRRWSRGRNSYVALMLGLVGAFLAIGAVGHRTVPWMLGALCVLASPLAVIRSDIAARKNPDGSRRTPMHTELLWLLAAALMAIGGTATFVVFA
jgi:hypothetical protein